MCRFPFFRRSAARRPADAKGSPAVSSGCVPSVSAAHRRRGGPDDGAGLLTRLQPQLPDVGDRVLALISRVGFHGYPFFCSAY